MELDFSNRFVFVINKAKVQKGKVVFIVSVKDIDLVNPTGNMNLLTQIPIGSFLNVRFDIDPTLYTLSFPSILLVDGETPTQAVNYIASVYVCGSCNITGGVSENNVSMECNNCQSSSTSDPVGIF